jgi:hypothetical protein
MDQAVVAVPCQVQRVVAVPPGPPPINMPGGIGGGIRPSRPIQKCSIR